MFTATLIAADRLTAGDISAATDLLSAHGIETIGTDWIETGTACDISIRDNGPKARSLLEECLLSTDVVVQLSADRRRKLIVADMDSTMITVECIDELADYAGIKPQIADVTERAMRGELDFESALRSRVALLAGLPESAIESCLAERVKIMPGAKELIQTIKALGGRAVLVSGGFTRFAEPVGAAIGFDRVLANRLGISNGMLDGTVSGAIVGAQAKRDILFDEMDRMGLDQKGSLAVGDGANDIPMIETAGLGIAYHAKPKTAAAAAAKINHGDLTSILYAMGIPKSRWATI